MSVPVLSLRGSRLMSRLGEALLMNAGLPDWIAEDADHLVQLAVAQAFQGMWANRNDKTHSR